MLKYNFKFYLRNNVEKERFLNLRIWDKYIYQILQSWQLRDQFLDYLININQNYYLSIYM